jgi:hypothetical protein
MGGVEDLGCIYSTSFLLFPVSDVVFFLSEQYNDEFFFLRIHNMFLCLRTLSIMTRPTMKMSTVTTTPAQQELQETNQHQLGKVHLRCELKTSIPKSLVVVSETGGP